MAEQIFCTNCGAQLDPQARFCTECGSPILSKPPYVAESQPVTPTVSRPTPPARDVAYPPSISSERLAIIESKKKSPGVAAVLSLLWTGVGQIYVGKAGRGIVFMIIAFFCFLSLFLLIGIILVPIWWIYGIYDAYNLAKTHNVELMRLA
ncbi:MAG: zinc-ribbon domain-containing protein [Candidatus Heimdallarchaeota archaeon]